VHPSSSALDLASCSEGFVGVAGVVLAGSFGVASEDVSGVGFVSTPEPGASAAESILAAHDKHRGPRP